MAGMIDVALFNLYMKLFLMIAIVLNCFLVFEHFHNMLLNRNTVLIYTDLSRHCGSRKDHETVCMQMALSIQPYLMSLTLFWTPLQCEASSLVGNELLIAWSCKSYFGGRQPTCDDVAFIRMRIHSQLAVQSHNYCTILYIAIP